MSAAAVTQSDNIVWLVTLAPRRPCCTAYATSRVLAALRHLESASATPWDDEINASSRLVTDLEFDFVHLSGLVIELRAEFGAGVGEVLRRLCFAQDRCADIEIGEIGAAIAQHSRRAVRRDGREKTRR